MVLPKRRYIYAAGIMLAVTVAVYFAVWGTKQKAVISGHVPKVTGAITVQQVNRLPVGQYYETSGTVKAQVISKVAPKAMGEVTAVYVQPGDRVTTGQVLAELADQDLSRRIAVAQAAKREAENGLEIALRNRDLQQATYNRYAELYDQAAISSQQLDEIRTRHEIAGLAYQQALAGMEKADGSLEEIKGNTRLVSPLNGLVTEKKLELGNMLQPGVPVITVEDSSSFMVECYVGAELHDRIRPGMPVEVSVESTAQLLTGQVSEVMPAVDAASRSFLVKMSLSGEALKTGLYAKVHFLLGQQPALLVPKAALVEKGQLTGVYVVDQEKRVWYRIVRTGKTTDGKVEVVSGLKGGEQVVIQGTENVMDGALAKEVREL